MGRNTRQPGEEPADSCPRVDKTGQPRAADAAHEELDGDLGLRVADILEALPFYVLLLDGHHHILQANSAVREKLGLLPAEIVGRYCPKVVHGLDEPWPACPLEEAVAKGQAVEREALDPPSGRWIRSAIYPTRSHTEDGRRIYFHTVSDITEAKEVEEQLRTSREQLRELSRYLESVREDERTRLARELHDELGQTLTALKIDLSWLARRVSQEPESLLAKIGSMNQTIDGAIQTVKRVSSELRPGMLDDLGLPAAIEWLTQDFGRLTGLKCTFSARCGDVPIDHDLSTALFRICQEALTNVIRHAQATRIAVSLNQDLTRITLKVRDDGKGIEKTEILDPRAFGLIGMRERARLWGGEVRFSGTPGKGTVVAVSIPFVEGT